MSCGEAPGKVILLGEHFVVHGVEAIAVPVLSRTVTVTVDREPGAWAVAEVAREPIAAMLRHLGEDPAALRVSVAATLPFGAGLGGSAALAVALVRALGASDAAEVRARAHQLERLAHGDPSGIDDAVATWAQPVRYLRGRGPDPIAAPGPLPLWIGLTPVGASTREAVAQVAALRAREPDRFGALERQAVGVVAAGIAALQAGDLAALGRAMNDNHALLAALGVSTPTLDGLVHAAREAGALGAKLTGGGLGGAVIALAPVGRDLGPALMRAGAQEVIQP